MKTHYWIPVSPEGEEGCRDLPSAPSVYHRMMKDIDSVFDDALGQETVSEGPVAPGTVFPPG